MEEADMPVCNHRGSLSAFEMRHYRRQSINSDFPKFVTSTAHFRLGSSLGLTDETVDVVWLC